ncbi:MAG: deoxyribose-phosphate aldolase [Spirochaetales bacterium]|nr:deoxyribose-phosphate aldolase [Spirochaetales bacterium]
MPREWTKASLAATIDHTVLKSTTTERQARELCAEARNYGFAGVCVNPVWVPACVRELQGSKLAVCSVVGFPLGAVPTDVKVEEARIYAKSGVRELEVVIDLGAAKGGDWKHVEGDLRAVVKAAGPVPVKVIIETCYLTDPEKVRACECAARAGARFVQTGTGFGSGGAMPEDVRLMKKAVGEKLLVKASGGIRTYHDAIALLEAGADRLGSSSSVAIISELPE